MIDIPEERILKEITDILMNDLPKVLLELEEQLEDSIHLPPFRYVGLEENLPPGTGVPYALVYLEESSYSEKDRIVKNQCFSMTIRILLTDNKLIWYYFASSEKTLAEQRTAGDRYTFERKTRSGTLRIIITH